MTPALHARRNQIFDRDLDRIRRGTDRLMARLMIFQWAAAMVAAFVISPLSWRGADSYTHIHVFAAVVLGGLLTAAPVCLVFFAPGRATTRHVNAVSQVLFSAMFIHLTGGRIETHFHVFGSLAILALYRDWKVLLTATAVVGLDHLLRGVYWPQSVYGVLSSTPWRSLEHVFWVTFEDAFLIYGCVRSIHEMQLVARRQQELEDAHEERRKAMRRLELQSRALDQCAIVAETDAQGRITYVNDRFCDISGFSRDELLGHDHRLLNSDYHSRSFFDHMYSTIYQGNVWRGEVKNRRKDGSFYWLDTAIVPFLDDSGNPEGFFTIRTDITERKEATEELESVVERLDLATNAGNIGIWDHDLVTGRVTWCESMHRLYGTDPASFQGMYEEWEQRVHPDDLQPARECVQSALHGPNEFATEFRIITPDGEVRHIAASGTVKRDQFNCAVRMIGVNTDITTLRDARERAEEASRAKSDFLASMSHELRTPLNGVLGMIELLVKTSLNERQKSLLAACRQSGQALLQLVNDILDLSKIEACKLELDIHPFELKPLVIDTFRMMSWHADQKGLRATCRIDPAAHLALMGDSGRLRQILINLISNAVKFTTEGSIDVRVTARQQRDNSVRIRVSVSDTGIGIPHEKQSRLFQSFFQVDSSTTRKYGGTGLGLAICSMLVDLMGGEIGVDSEEGVGSEFWCEIPMSISDRPCDQSPGQDPCSEGALCGRRVLIVDRREAFRQHLEGLAWRWQMECTSASGVDEALDAIDATDAAGTPFDVVVASVHLTKGNNRDLFQWLSLRDDLPVILTDTTGREPKDEIVALGVDATVCKPVRESDLYHELVRLLGRDSFPESTRVLSATADDSEADEHMTGTQQKTGPRVLLAEDNQINSRYMSEVLSSLGCSCDIAENGRRAVAAVRDRDYDLVLMDCQMPEMDGFDATRVIRQMEADHSLAGRLPIVALTANAIKGDREQCLNAGMDEYLTKPVMIDDVAKMIDRFLHGRGDCRTESPGLVATESPSPSLPPVGNDSSSAGTAGVSSNSGFDAGALLQRCLGRAELAYSLLDEFESTGQARAREIADFARNRDSSGVRESAHSLKGAAGILCADRLQKLAAVIEHAGVEGRLDDIQATIGELSEEMDHCLSSLSDVRRQLHKA
ncbi:PAS domain-containing protein [bacterium]|nr:PAS domain-containing protein [bacterium]